MATSRDPLVGKVINIYRKWYGVTVCSEAAWNAKAAEIQDIIDECQIVIPVPTMDLHEDRPQIEVPDGNPVEMDAILKKYVITSQSDRFAGRVAQILREAGHMVFYVNHSLAVSAQYSGNDLLVRDILTSAPVVVYHENADGRQNGWVQSLLMSRKKGYAVVVTPRKVKRG